MAELTLYSWTVEDAVTVTVLTVPGVAVSGTLNTTVILTEPISEMFALPGRMQC